MEELTKERKIAKNRDEIEMYLNSKLPLDIIYFNIRRLSAQNERLLKGKNYGII